MASPKRTYTLHINVYPDQKKWLTNVSVAYGQSESEVVRLALGLLESLDEENRDHEKSVRNTLIALRRGMRPAGRNGRKLPSAAG